MDHLNFTRLPGNLMTSPATNQSDVSSVFTHQILPAFYLLACMVGVSLNSLAVWIFFRVPSDSGLVVYLKNMVVADLIMVLTFPVRMASEMGLGGWQLRVVVCRYTAVLFYSSMYVGIVFMGLISLERYVKIVRHSSSSSSTTCLGVSCSLRLLQTVSCARALALVVWCLLLLCVLPNVLLTSLPADEETSLHCMRLKTPLGVQWHRVSTLFNVALFWATLLVLAFCYASIAQHIYKSYRRVQQDDKNVCRKSNRSIFSLLAVFCICFVPYHICRVPYTFSQMPGSGYSQNSRFLLFQLKEGTLFLSSLNVCLDPVIYILMCRTFRETLLRKLSGTRRPSLTNTMSLMNL